MERGTRCSKVLRSDGPIIEPSPGSFQVINRRLYANSQGSPIRFCGGSIGIVLHALCPRPAGLERPEMAGSPNRWLAGGMKASPNQSDSSGFHP